MDADALISAYCDGSLTAAQRRGLFAQVSDDPVLARRFADLVTTHYRLVRLAALECEAVAERDERPARARPAMRFASLAAGLLLIAALCWRWLAPGQATPDWQVDGAPADLVAGERFAPRTACSIALADGSRLRLAAGSAILPQPADGSARLRLLHGTIVADIAAQPAERPFIIDTPDGSCRVLGTRFELHSDAAGSCLRVIEGRVAAAFGNMQEHVVTAGETLRTADRLPSGIIPPMEQRFLQAARLDPTTVAAAERWLKDAPAWSIDWQTVEAPAELLAESAGAPLPRLLDLVDALGRDVLLTTPGAADETWHRRTAARCAQRWPASSRLTLLLGRPSGDARLRTQAAYGRIWRAAFQAAELPPPLIAWPLANSKDLGVDPFLATAPLADHPDLLMLRGFLGIAGRLPADADPEAPGHAAIVQAMRATVADFRQTLQELRQRFAQHGLRVGVYDCGLHVWGVSRQARDRIYRPVLAGAGQADIYRSFWQAFPPDQGPCQLWLPWWLYRKQPSDGAWTELELGMTRALQPEQP